MKKELFMAKKGLLVMLMAAMACVFTACGSAEVEESNEIVTENDEALASEVMVIGSGETAFRFLATLSDGSEVDYLVYTDETTVGPALVANGLVETEDSGWGAFVTAVLGDEVLFENEGTYWAFLVNGQMSDLGIDSVEINEEDVYSFIISQ